MSVNFRSKGGTKANDAMRRASSRYIKELEKQNEDAVELATIFVVGEAKRNIKRIKSTEGKLIDTGRMINSLANEVRKLKNIVVGLAGTNLFYAKFHEFGTRNIPARPYLRPAITENRNKIIAILTKELNKAAKKVDKK